jgi:ankyrin repeat protein
LDTVSRLALGCGWGDSTTDLYEECGVCGLVVQDPIELGAQLCNAASEGDLKTLQTLVENGADINQGCVLRLEPHILICTSSCMPRGVKPRSSALL